MIFLPDENQNQMIRIPLYTTYTVALDIVESVKYLCIDISAQVRWNKNVDSTPNTVSATFRF